MGYCSYNEKTSQLNVSAKDDSELNVSVLFDHAVFGECDDFLIIVGYAQSLSLGGMGTPKGQDTNALLLQYPVRFKFPKREYEEEYDKTKTKKYPTPKGTFVIDCLKQEQSKSGIAAKTFKGVLNFQMISDVLINMLATGKMGETQATPEFIDSFKKQAFDVQFFDPATVQDESVIARIKDLLDRVEKQAKSYSGGGTKFKSFEEKSNETLNYLFKDETYDKVKVVAALYEVPIVDILRLL